MSLAVKPIGQSSMSSGTVNAPAADALLAEIQALPPGWYLIQGYTLGTGGVAFQANIKLVVGPGGATGELARCASGLRPCAFEFVTWLQGNNSVRLLVVAADPAGAYSANNLTVTPIEPPEVV